MNKSELKDVLKASYMPQKEAAAYLKKHKVIIMIPNYHQCNKKYF